MAEHNFSPLSQLIDVSKIPGNFSDLESFAQEGVDVLLGKIRYKEYAAEATGSQDTVHHKIVIVSKALKVSVPGTDLGIVFFKGFESNESEFPIYFTVKWPIKKYIKGFSISDFTFSPDAFVDTLLSLTNSTKEQFLKTLVSQVLDGYRSSIPDLTEELKFRIEGHSDGNPLVDSEIVTITSNLDDLSNRFLEILNSSSSILASDIIESFLSDAVLDTAISNIHAAISTLDDDLDVQINIVSEAIKSSVQLFSNEENKFQVITNFFSSFTSGINRRTIEELLIPQFSFELKGIPMALEFPRKILKPMIESSPGVWEVDNTLVGNPQELIKASLNFTSGPVRFDSRSGFDIRIDENLTIDLPRCQIGNSEFELEFLHTKLDLSKTKNIPEASADGRPNDFIGAYIMEGSIYFPAFWNHDDPNSTGVVKARNFLIGTGGISGKLGLEAKSGTDPSPLIQAKFGSGFEVSLNAFYLEFQQNAIIGSEIKGTMKIPGFKDANDLDAELEIDVHIGQDGDFSVTISEADGIELKIPQVLTLLLRSASVGREDDRFFLSVSGQLSFSESPLGSIMSSAIDVQEIIIWDDGQYEIKGGGLELPKAIGLTKGPLNIAVTSIHLGSDEREYVDGSNTVLRKYKYFGFDGMVKMDPGGVDAKGQGIKFYFSEDTDYGGRHVFLRVDSIKVDLVFPGDANKDNASMLINGWLSIKDAPTGVPGSEYAGGVMVDMPKTGAGGSVQMKFNPKVPYFIIDVEIEPEKAIPLGSTGLGLYGYRGLIGKHYIASKTEADVLETDPWWKYYKAKIASQYKEGVQVDKFAPTGGFSVGLGVSLASSTDGGKIFSSKIFLLLSLRELLMLQGQAAILSERVKLSDPNDPPFFAQIVITKESVEAALGVNYLIPDDKADVGSTATVQGVLELGFFFKDSSAWYLNIGRDFPESYRIQVRLVEMFDCYFYFMLNAKGIRMGAGASFEWGKKWGPLEAYLYAYLDVAAKVAFKPKQFGGSIQLGGGIDISLFGLGFGITAAAGLAAEAPEPFNISGFIEACFKAVGKEWCAKFDFSWEREPNVDTSRIGVVNNGERGIASACQAVNIQTQQIFPVNYKTTSGSGVMPPAVDSSEWKGSFDDFVIPMDSFIDLDFTNGMNPLGGTSTEKFGVMGGGSDHIRKVAPQKGKTPSVLHNFKADEIIVYAWNPSTEAWVEYDIYAAVTEWTDPTGQNTPPAYNTLDLKQGYWQMEEKSKYNKLRILAQNPLSYTSQISGEFIPENNGVTSESIFCDETERAHTCVNFANYIPTRKLEVTDWTTDFTATGLPIPSSANSLNLISGAYPTQQLGFFDADHLYVYGDLSLVTSEDGGVVTSPITLNGNTIGLGIIQNSSIEINFNEPMVCIDFNLATSAADVTIEYYRLIVDPNGTGNNVMEELITSTTLTQASLNNNEQQYLDETNPVDKMIIRSGSDLEGKEPGVLCEPELTMEGEQLEEFFATLVEHGHLLTSLTLNDASNTDIYDRVFFNSPLYQWGGTTNAPQLDYTVNVDGDTVVFNIFDDNGYDCTTTLIARGEFDWNNVTRFSNLRKDPAYSGEGSHNHFLLDAEINGSTTELVSGHSTCHTVLNCYDGFSTWLYSLCYLNVEDYAFNQTVLDSAANTAQVNSMMDGLEKTIQPIWRPNTKFAVAVKVSETVSGGGSAAHSDSYFFGFQTAGPVGHFHRYLDNIGNEVVREDYQNLLDQDQEESYALRNLKPYINYAVSYPNANGDLLNAKPLFYEDTKILLFFTRPYVYHMFENWASYLGNAATTSSMLVDIRDAVEPLEPPVSQVTWQFEKYPILDADSLLLNNMVQNAPPTGCEPNSLNPFGVHAQVDVTGLKPLKLYTAMVFNQYGDGTNPSVKREVHKYPFRTSRYANFAEQIQSYILATDEQSVPIKKAIYDVTIDVNFDLSNAIAMIPAGSTIMLKDYADKIERILQGGLKVGTLQPPISTEFNFVTNGEVLLGVWIRNPEPFNDPKIPMSNIENSISLTIDNTGGFLNFFSKDGRDVFITNESMNLPSGDFEFTFNYLEWNKMNQQFESTTSESVLHTIVTTA